MLRAIRVTHTFIWAVLAASVLAIPVIALLGSFEWAIALSSLVLLECGILAWNGGRCPLTDWAARYTESRADNFDIYLPNWLARHNKVIFGALFLVGEAIRALRWMTKL